MRARIGVAVALMAVLAACGGPRSQLEVGVREIDTDVLIGPRGLNPTPSLPPSSGPPPGFPGFVQPPTSFPGVPSPRPSPPPDPCPSAHPFSPVLNPVTSSVEEPPVAQRYRYRNDGAYTVGERSGRFPPESTRDIANITRDEQTTSFTYEMTAPGVDGSRTTTRYRVVTDAPQPPAVDPGIYIEQVTTTTASGDAYVFAPTPSLMLMRLPAVIGQPWTARGIDPLAQIVMQFTGTISAATVVDACGVRLEAWQVDITEGSIRGPSTELTFTATIGIGTQYGGIPVLDTVKQDGVDRGVRLTSENTARISEEPELP